MYLYAGIASIIIGVAVSVLGFTNMVPHVGSTGIALVLFGGLLIGLNFVPEPEKEELSEPMPIWERMTKIFFAPAEVFRSFRSHPRWIGAIVVVALISGIYAYTFVEVITPEVIVNKTMEGLSESGFVQPEQLAEIKKQNLEVAQSKVARIGGIVNSFVGFSFWVAFVGAIYLLIVLALGGKMNYWQGVAAAAYAIFPVVFIQKAFSFLILFLKDPTEIHPILGQNTLLMDNLGFLVTPGDSPVLYVLLASFSLTAFYGIFLTATGINNAGTRVSSSTGWIIAVIFFLLAITLGVVSALLFGSFF